MEIMKGLATTAWWALAFIVAIALAISVILAITQEIVKKIQVMRLAHKVGDQIAEELVKEHRRQKER